MLSKQSAHTRTHTNARKIGVPRDVLEANIDVKYIYVVDRNQEDKYTLRYEASSSVCSITGSTGSSNYPFRRHISNMHM